ncbi:MAG: efflux RND transporter periplasmic adaptor subunit [Hyphomonadaceae bacterium]|jgi:cobalt-zinc-cadmium efflux system membrane fusion protein
MKFTKLMRGSSAMSLTAVLLSSLVPFSTVSASDDHGEAGGATTAAGPALPSFEAANDRFEVVGRVQSDALKIWLDDWATNAPVPGAKIALTIAGRKVVATAAADGTYNVPFPEADKAGNYPIGLNITGAGNPVLLGATLVVSDVAVHVDEKSGFPSMWLLGGGALALVVVGGGLVLMRRRRTAALASIGVLAGMSLVGLGVAPHPVIAGAGHDHGEEAAGPAGASPDQASRLGNGDLSAPKSMQRLIGLRTIVGATTNSTQTLTLNGIVIPDPNASGVVQSQIGGRVSGNLPALGDSVGRGQAMAMITPGFDPGARTALVADQGLLAQESALAQSRAARLSDNGGAAEIRVRLHAAQQRLARLERLEGVVPAREIEAASIEVRAIQAQIAADRAETQSTLNGLRARQAALTRLSSSSEIARAPVSGIVSAVSVSQGQVVASGETLFTIVNPSRLLVEAQANGSTAAGIGGQATARTADGRTMTLLRQGAGLSLINGSAPIRFLIELSDGLRAGEPVTVFAGSSVPNSGIAVPRLAVARGANGQAIVFVKKSAETFAPVAVVVTDLDADRVLVTSGLSAGQRIVVAGSPLLAQVR